MRAHVTLQLIIWHFASLFSGVSARSLRSPLSKSVALSDQVRSSRGGKLIPWLAKKQWAKNKKRMRMHMLARESEASQDDNQPIEGCIACFGIEVIYGKYRTEDGDHTDNSYYLFKDPHHKQGDEPLPIIIQFHHGGFFDGQPWKKENSDVKSYISKGFAVVSVGYRLVTEKYIYPSKDGENKTEELIHVSKDGKLSLDARGRTMEDHKVQVGKMEFMTKYLYDASQMMEDLIGNAKKFGLDIHRIVFVGESTGGAGMQYLSWVYHKWNIGRYTPRGMVYHNAQLNYPVNNMLDKSWDLFVDTMGPSAKLSDVMSLEACPVIIGNHMCGSPIGESSDYELCNHVWNKKALSRFCGKVYKTATLGEVRKQQVWPKADIEGMDALWYNSENIQRHLPHDPFYLYVANSMNGTDAVDVAHHSIFALSFAKFAELGKQDGLQYTVYYTDFAHMTEADHGMQRLEVSRAPGDLGSGAGLKLPPSALPPSEPAAAPMMAAGAAPAPGPSLMGPAPAPAPAPSPSPEDSSGTTVFNYLSTHNWREDFAGRDVEAGSAEERILYACLAAAAGPFRDTRKPNTTREDHFAVGEGESGALQSKLSTLSLILLMLATMSGHSE